MKSRIAGVTLIGFVALSAAAPSSAQQGPVEVAFELPLNLTRLASRVTKVKVNCTLTSGAIIAPPAMATSRPNRRDVAMELPVSQGDVVQSVRLVVSLTPQELDNPSGKQASYQCELHGFDSVNQAWIPFAGSSGAGIYSSSMVLTPAPTPITGMFVW